MATKGEQIGGLRDFFVDSFRASELEMFLTVNGYEEVAAAVNQSVGSIEYFFNVVQALNRRGLIDDEFFVRLRRERPAKDALIRGLQESWLVEGKTSPNPSGETTSSGPRTMIDAEPPVPQHQTSVTPVGVHPTGSMDNAHALIVGIADYQYIPRLPQVQDARKVAGLLIDPDHGGYRPENVTILLDKDATQAAIRDGLSALASRSVPDSTVLIYFSGHGGRIESGPHTGEYLLPVDTIYPRDEELARTAISGDEFLAALKAIQARKVVIIVDCCHAGGVGQPPDLVGAPVTPGWSDDYYERLKAGRVILASSRPSEFSYVIPGAESGLFTEHLVGGLGGGVASDDGLVRILDLFEYIQPRVTKAHPQQHPLLKGELAENFAVALYRGGTRGVVPKLDGEFRYDAYVSYVDQGADADFVWDTLVPKLESAGLRVAVSGDSADPGVPRIVGGERAIRQAKRTVVVLSEAYLADSMADFENVLGQTMSIQEGSYRLLPLKIAPIATDRLPVRLGMLETLDLTHPRRTDRNYERLIKALQGPLPTR
jgi:hypothetical protein